MNAAQAANEVSRTDWQVLNVIHESSGASLAQVTEPLSPFASEVELRDIVAGLAARGWLSGAGAPGEPFRLTASGAERHAIILAQQQEVRRQAMSGVSDEEYATVMRVLERIVKNLEGASS